MDNTIYMYVDKYVNNLKIQLEPDVIKAMTSEDHMYRFEQFHAHICKPFLVNPKYIKSKWDIIYPIILKYLV